MVGKAWRLVPLGVCVMLAGCATPKAIDDTVMVPPDTATRIDVLANDSNPNGSPLIIKRVWGGDKGSVTINPDNTLTYTPKAGETGRDSFQYRMKDNQGHATNATVMVDISTRAVAVVAPSTVVVVPPPQPGRVMGTPENPPPLPAVASGPFIQSIFVTLHTTGDDKNREEPVRIVIRRENEILADKTVGGGDLWGSFTDNSYDLPLNPQPSLADAGRLVLEIRKTPIGSANGGGWSMQTDARARMSDGTTAVVLPMTQQVKMGDDAPSDRNWTLVPPK